MSSILLPISPAGTTSVASGLWLASGIVPNISGEAVSVSGNVVILSGITQVSVMSGEVHIMSGTVAASISGNVAYLSPTTQSGNNFVLEVGTNTIFPTASGTGLGSFQSGGMVLASCGPLVSATIRSLSGNLPMLIGGSAGGAGVSGTAAITVPNVGAPGVGIELFANESLTLKVNNTNKISVLNQTAGSSGQRVTIVGLLQT